MTYSEFYKQVPFMDSLQIKDAMSIEINFVQLKLETLMFSSKYPPPPTSLKNKQLHYIKEKKNDKYQEIDWEKNIFPTKD